MSISVLAAAKHIGGLSDWSKTNLELQKIIYLAHMIYLGENDLKSPLVQGNFQAWNLGPVHPILYHKAKIFGDNPVQNIFRSVVDLQSDQPEAQTLELTFSALSNFSSSDLVAITHWEKGAWAKNYEPEVRGITIPNSDIIAEYEKRRQNRERRETENGG